MKKQLLALGLMIFMTPMIANRTKTAEEEKLFSLVNKYEFLVRSKINKKGSKLARMKEPLGTYGFAKAIRILEGTTISPGPMEIYADLKAARDAKIRALEAAKRAYEKNGGPQLCA